MFCLGLSTSRQPMELNLTCIGDGSECGFIASYTESEGTNQVLPMLES